MPPKGSKSPPEPYIYISVADAEKLYELYENVEMADAHFHTCQAVNFRQHIQSVYKADNVAKAFANLQAEISKIRQQTSD